ncbi:shugoshin 2 isoform X2 [Dendropsophus ebraccatus]
MDVTASSSTSVLQSVKERMREKLNGSLKALKLQTSLAAKIKTKTLNNSSILKVSLKHNNKALACALTAEREKSRRLENDRMFLQKEVKMLHFQNALLRQNLCIVNKMLKDIDVYMNINLSSAIEISSNMESPDRCSLNVTRSERFSQQSELTQEEDQGDRLTGVALRVPSSSVEHQKRVSYQTSLVNELNQPTDPLSLSAPFVKENSVKLDETEIHILNDSPKDYLSIHNENRSRGSLSNWQVSDSLLPLDEVYPWNNRTAQSGGYVTKRKKRSTASQSSTVSKTSDTNQTRSTVVGSSSPKTAWETKTDLTILPDLGHTGLDEAVSSCNDSVWQKGRLSTSHRSSVFKTIETNQSKEISKGLCEEKDIQSTNQPQPELIEESNHYIVDGCLGQEITVYKADMEMASSESAEIVAALPKTKTHASKSCIPVQQSSTLRKVKKSACEKSKNMECSVIQQVTDSCDSSKRRDPAVNYVDDLISDKCDPIPYVLPGPVVHKSLDVTESRTQSILEMSESGESCVTGQIVIGNATELNSGKSKMSFIPENHHYTEADNIADMAPKKRKSKTKEASHMENSKKKRCKTLKTSKDLERLSEVDNMENDSTEEVDSSKEINAISSFQVKNKERKIQRKTYIVSATKQYPVTNDPEVHGLCYRRETIMIPEPSPLVTVTVQASVLEDGDRALVEPQTSMNSAVLGVVSTESENGSNTEKSHSEKELCNPSLYHDNTCEKQISKCSEKKASSGLFSALDRRTYVLPSKQDSFRGEKATLVRESFMNLPSSQDSKARKFTDMKPNVNDTFMLDMVSESILDNTMEFSSSFVEFPSDTNPESTFTRDMSLTRMPAPELPASEDCSNEELSRLLTSNNVLNENVSDQQQQDTRETEIGTNHLCKIEDQSMEIHETAIKPFLDLTNKSLGSTKQSPKSCSQEESGGHSRRQRNPVNYKEPSLGT